MRFLNGFFASCLAVLVTAAMPDVACAQSVSKNVKFITLAPGHFHAALVQKFSLPGVDNDVHVYAPLDFDLTEHLQRIVGFNSRADAPTDWRLEVHAGPDFLNRFRKEKPGNVVIISGKNGGKIDLIRAAVESGLNVLVDKPWIIRAQDVPILQGTLALATKKGLLAYDIMTERFEATNALQRELVNSPEVFGEILKGTPENPGVYIEDLHHYMKFVSGRPNIRPTWYFDTTVQGEGMADTGTHLVDLVQWTLAPEQIIDFEKDIAILRANRWPTRLSKKQFTQVTGADDFPPSLADHVKKGKLDVYSNAMTVYTFKDVYVQLASLWGWQAKKGAGDWKYALYRGSKASVESRQGPREKHRPELFVKPAKGTSKKARAALKNALEKRLAQLARRYPGLSVEDKGTEFHIIIPDVLRTGHEAHFGEVTANYLKYLEDRSALPAWETPNMLTKYRTTTAATMWAGKSDGKKARLRIAR